MLKINLTLFIIVFCGQFFAQSVMNIHKTDGTTLQIPVNTIDSITYATLELPTVTTDNVLNITSSSAELWATVTFDGNSPITDNGFAYSTSPVPSFFDFTGTTLYTDAISGSATFYNNLTNLTENTTYYVRAYATNSMGATFGNELVFTTEALVPVYCEGNPTAIVDVVNPITGRIWMDRNLGATQAATSSNDVDAYGDLYQWGRFSDGHQCRTSANTSTLSSTNQPGHGFFITSSTNDWLSSPGDGSLWQGENSTNNPCPGGYRLPTDSEFYAETQTWDGGSSWNNTNTLGAINSVLKLPTAGKRIDLDGSLNNVGTFGYYWSSTNNASSGALPLIFGASGNGVGLTEKAKGFSVRCIKD